MTNPETHSGKACRHPGIRGWFRVSQTPFLPPPPHHSGSHWTNDRGKAQSTPVPSAPVAGQANAGVIAVGYPKTGQALTSA